MLPAAIGPAIGMAGNIIGGIGATQDLNQGLRDYNRNVGLGTGVLERGMQAATAGYSPYTGAGATGAAGELAAVQNRQQAQGPQLSNTGPGGVSAWLDPSMAYSADQARKQAMASGLATGGVGGGLLKAISNNANQMAQTNWNNAAGQQLAANNQNFGQGQQQYENNTNYQQQQIGNYGGIANRGLQSQSALQGQLGQYNTGINQNYNNMADQAMGVAGQRANIFNNTANATAKGGMDMFNLYNAGGTK